MIIVCVRGVAAAMHTRLKDQSRVLVQQLCLVAHRADLQANFGCSEEQSVRDWASVHEHSIYKVFAAGYKT